MSVALIYKFFLVLIHGLFSGLEFLYDIWIYVKINIIENTRSSVLDERYLLKLQQFEKIPKHITVILGTEKPSFRDLANLILWSLSAGIPFISFYDHEGFIQHHEEDLKYEVNNLKQEKDLVIFTSKEVNGVNGFKTHKNIQVKTLNLLDGRQTVVDVTKDIAGKFKPDEVNVELVDAELRKHYEFPDPNLALYCGKHFNIFGYPPWFIKFTEFINVRTFHNMSQQCFFDILNFYNKVNQKLGK